MSYGFGFRNSKSDQETLLCLCFIYPLQTDNNPASIGDTVEQWLAIEFSAAALEKVNPAILKQEEDGQPHLYRGAQAELFFVENGPKLVRFEMTFFGNFVEGDSNGKLRSGVLDEDMPLEPRTKGSTIVRYAKKGHEEILVLAKRFVASVRTLSPKHRALLEQMLQLKV